MPLHVIFIASRPSGHNADTVPIVHWTASRCTGLARLEIEPHNAERVLDHAQHCLSGTYDRHGYFDEKRAGLGRWAELLMVLTGHSDTRNRV